MWDEYTARTSRCHPGSASLIATIALGISAATSIFSLVATVWKPLPYRDADRLYWIARTDESWRTSPVLASHWNSLSHALPDYHQWSGASTTMARATPGSSGSA